MPANRDLADRTADQVEELRQVLLKPEALIHRISPIIADILKEQIENSHDEIAQAIAPVIGEAIRRQVYQAREDIVDALYPVIGQTINRAVAEAIRDLAQTVDTRVRQSIHPQNTWRRWQARLQGVSEAEYRLRESLPCAVSEIFLIHRDTGLLIHHLSGGGEVLLDRDLVSGMLTAIRDFAREAFGRGQSGELGAIEYASHEILLEAGGAAYLAVVIDGVEPTGFREEMREALIMLHERHYDDLKRYDGTNEQLVETAEKVLTSSLLNLATPQFEGRGPLSLSQRLVLVGLLLLILLPPVLGCGWWIWHVERSLAALSAMIVPSPTPSLMSTATMTPSPTATATLPPTVSPTPTPTNTPPPTSTPIPTPTSTPTPTFTVTPNPTIPPTMLPSPTVRPTLAPILGKMVGTAYLRNAPADEAGNTGQVAAVNASLEILAQYGDWYHVRVVNPDRPDVEIRGWLPARWINLLQSIPSTIITPTVVP